MFQLSLKLLGFWGFVHALQWLVDLSNWRDGGALGWDLHQLRRSRVLSRLGMARPFAALLSVVFSSVGMTVLAASVLAVSIALMFNPSHAQAIGLLSYFWISVLLLALRSQSDGADKIALVVAAGLALQALGGWSGNSRLELAGVLWVGGQLTIAYFASGVSKLRLAPWRNGQALKGALSSYMWGNRFSATLVGRPRRTLIMAWTIMLVEAIFPLALVAPLPWLCGALGMFFAFHLGIAWVMGLNTYPWAFLAAYPSVLVLSQSLRSASGMS